jgi:two-component system response regulator AtoC
LIKRMIVLDDPFLARIPLPESDGNGGRSHGAAAAPPATLAVPMPSLKEIGRRALQAAEREAIASMLEQTGWNRVRAARALRISYRALLYKIKQAGLDVERSSARSVL